MNNNKFTKDDVEVLRRVMPLVTDRLYEIIKLSNKEFGTTYDYVESFEITGDDIEVRGDEKGCSCCPSDSYYVRYPISFLFSDDWVEERKAELEIERVKAKEKREEKKVQKAKRLEEKEKEEYIRLKEKFNRE